MILKIEDLENTRTGIPLVLETHRYMRWCIFSERTITFFGNTIYWFTTPQKLMAGFQKEEYNKKWRLWSKMPSIKEQERHKWKDVKYR